MSSLKERQKAEAISRMKKLNIHEQTIKEFEESGVVNKSEGIGYLFWLSDNEKEIVAEFEKEYGAMVFHVIHSLTNFGELYNLLFVSKHEEEWASDNADLDDSMYVIAQVVNATYPEFSEMGGIIVEPSIGGLVRKE